MTRRSVQAGIICLMTLVGLDGIAAQTAAPTRRPRASWLVNRQELKVGDIVTVVVDEQVTSNERANKIASADRQSDMSFSANFPDFTLPVSGGGLSSQNAAMTRNLGQATRLGALASVFTVRVVSVEPTGMLRLEGERLVEVDGRAQEMQLTGLIRPEDVTADNLVFSNRVADAVITFKGGNISPSRGLLAKILGIFWP